MHPTKIHHLTWSENVDYFPIIFPIKKTEIQKEIHEGIMNIVTAKNLSPNIPQKNPIIMAPVANKYVNLSNNAAKKLKSFIQFWFDLNVIV